MEQQEHQANLLLGRAVGGPPYLSYGEARAILIVRLTGFLRAQSGVTPDLCRYLAARLADDFVPAIPRSCIGCAGEIIPLAHAFQTFLGIGWVVRRDGSLQPASKALAERGAAPYRPASKEGIALIAGAPGAVALAASHWRSGLTLLNQLLLASAAAIDAMRAPLSSYDLRLADLGNDPLLRTILVRLGELLQGSPDERQSVQSPVSFRVVPQVLTNLSRVLHRMEEDIRRDLGAVSDSPAFIDGQFITSGGFHAVGLATDMDVLSIALAQALELSSQQMHRLLDHRFTGLPDQLTSRPGSQAGLIVVQKRAIGAIHEIRRLANPATIGVMDTSLGQEDAQTFAFEAAEKLDRIEALGREVVACLLLVCHQAWALRRDGAASGLSKLASAIGAIVPPIDQDRPFGEDIAKIVSTLETDGF